MNICMFSGRLTRDAELRHTQSGKPVTNFGLAVDCGFGEKKTTIFLNCVQWDKENLSKYLTKGKSIIIQGEYTERKWTDKEGQERRTVEIVVRNLEFQQGDPKQSGATQHINQGEPSGPAFPESSDGMDGIPF